MNYEIYNYIALEYSRNINKIKLYNNLFMMIIITYKNITFVLI